MIPSQLICKRFGFSFSELVSYSHTCPYRYKTYPIRKRQGGVRLISQPSKDLKMVQRFVLDEVLNKSLRVHDAAKAYKRNTSIIDNAVPHLKNSYLLKTDFKNFFPSIHDHDFLHYLEKHQIVKEKIEAEILARIFFKNSFGRLVLSIGSPGSPIISNALLYDFDEQIFSESKRQDIQFTRYSDDMTFSTCRQNILFEWPAKIKAILENMVTPSLLLNDDKTVFSSKKFNRHITGITITNDGKPSIGYKKKRQLRSAIFTADKLNDEERFKLRGYISFACQIEPELAKKFIEKYPKQMEKIMGTTFEGQ